MAGYRTRRTAGGAAVATAAALVAVGGLSGCSDHNASPGTGASKAASAASSLSSQAAQGLASASAEASRKLGEVKNGVNAKDEVKLGTPTTSAGRAVVEVTARNTARATKSFAVQVNYTDKSGNLLDTVVVTVPDVPAGKTGKATAHSHRALTGTVKAAMGKAVRY